MHRFLARPAAVVFGATGTLAPKPLAVIRPSAIAIDDNLSATKMGSKG